MQFPLNGSTFKKSFLDGDGSIEIRTDNDTWGALYNQDKPFPSNVQELVNLKFSAGTSKDFQFGQADGLKLTVGFNSEVIGYIDLIWPGEADSNELIKVYELKQFLTSNKIYLAIVFSAKGDASVKGSYPIGTLTPTFGIEAGGHVGYNRLALYDQSQSVKAILDDLFADIRLPQAVGSSPELPSPGEVIATQFGGYLNLSAGLTWGYSLTGTRSFEVRDLSLELDYAIKLAASVSIGYKLAGDYSFEGRRGTDDEWYRLIVRKNRHSEFDFAADFGIKAKADLKGLPATADEFLSALLGTDAETVLSYFQKAKKYSSLDELEKAVGKLTKGFLQQLSDKWLGKALDNDTLQKFLGVAQKVVDTYENLDQRIIDLYEDYLEKLPQLDQVLNLLLGVGSREDLKTLTDSEAWDIIRRLWNEKLHDLLLKDDEFAEFAKFIQKVKDFKDEDAAKAVRDLIAEIKKAFPLDNLFNQLKQFDTPEKLKALADEKLQGLAGRIIGKAFDEIKSNSDFKAAAQKVKDTLNKIDEFKNNWYKKLTDAVHQSFEFNLHYAYSRAKADEALLDVEININQPAAHELIKKAASGDFADLLSDYDPNRIRVNRGILTHNLTKSAQIQINALGWGYKGIVELVQNAQHAIETEAGGLMHVYTIDTYIKQKKEQGKKFKETLQSNFLFRAIGETFQPTGDADAAIDPKTKQFVIKTLRNMAVEYNLQQEDEKTDPQELTQYLSLAEFLGLIPNRERMVEELRQQFPSGLGKVKIDYVVRYDNQAVRSAFTLSGDDLRNNARQAMRQFIGAKYIGMRDKDWAARVGFAYLDPQFYSLYKQGFTALLAEGKAVTLPAWYTKTSALKVGMEPSDRTRVLTLFNVEKSYLDRLVKLDIVIDKATSGGTSISMKELADASHEFIKKADDLDEIRENSFFAIFDRLVQEGGSGKGRRESAMILEITSPGKDKVVKYLMA
jgi:hypothetical protein